MEGVSTFGGGGGGAGGKEGCDGMGRGPLGEWTGKGRRYSRGTLSTEQGQLEMPSLHRGLGTPAD